MDTIFALASAPGKSGVAVVRVSGPLALAAASQIAGELPDAQGRVLRALSWDGSVIDQALVLRFDRPNSFTGEDVIEFQTHGSPAVVSKLLSVLSELPGLRLAEPGEFTRRALENDRMDLSEVEGLADLIDAETEAQRRQAMRVFRGAMGTLVEGWRVRLVRAAALLEATIDFADEDVPVDVTPEVLALLNGVLPELGKEIAGARAAERIRDGFEVAIVGPPNAGKSTLLNALAGRDAAITSETAGTTRDVIEVRMDLAGLPVTVLDTAGLRETDDEIEGLGVDRALTRARAADLRIVLLESPGKLPVLEPEKDDLIVASKSDSVSGADFSALTGQGLDDLVRQVGAILERRASGVATATRDRHRFAIARAKRDLESAIERIKTGSEMTELAAEDVRSGVRALEGLLGRVDVEDLLDEIFQSFCIGK
ncbi:MAG: tRNA uridine-5-carboxymethylaminomethyl(34) synthesis GTPase MnmE [Paracoccaceae bacterium]|nr:tRNA uridine-5-carboxymethylaminomethyl(34) synthesis GTPase MnmE [Paracoccaceae bacterium]